MSAPSVSLSTAGCTTCPTACCSSPTASRRVCPSQAANGGCPDYCARLNIPYGDQNHGSRWMSSPTMHWHSSESSSSDLDTRMVADVSTVPWRLLRRAGRRDDLNVPPRRGCRWNHPLRPAAPGSSQTWRSGQSQQRVPQSSKSSPAATSLSSAPARRRSKWLPHSSTSARMFIWSCAGTSFPSGPSPFRTGRRA